MRRLTLLKLVGIVYFIFTAYALINIMRVYFEKSYKKDTISLNFKKTRHTKTKPDFKATHSVEIWGKAAIGLYLWQHIFEASLENTNGKFLRYGELQIENLKFRFHTGPSVTPQTVKQDVQNAILVINGRDPKKVKFASTWLKTLAKINQVNNLAVVLLGNEQCYNEWLMPFMARNGGIIKFAFIIYDVQYIDNVNFHPWPLGVATYRDFPVVHSDRNLVMARRKYVCNFLGTVYKNSSRITLINVIKSGKSFQKDCLINPRHKWLPHETKESSDLYQNAMKDSDLTLSPVGKNTECYRIYEAISYGSVPVIEDVMTPGTCAQSLSDNGLQTPLRILKRMHAPVIYIKNWNELSSIIAQERQYSLDFKIKRRTALLHWYQKFKYNLRNQFITKIKNGFNLD